MRRRGGAESTLIQLDEFAIRTAGVNVSTRHFNHRD